jgi:hypothetical protein
MIKIIKFHPNHLEMFQHLDVHGGEDIDFLQSYGGFAHTILRGNEVLGCVGGVLLWKGVFEIWGRFSVSIYKYPVAFSKTIAGLIKTYISDLKLHRIQTYARVGHPELDRWFKYLGFSCEGRLHKFSATGEDYFIMGLTV